MSQALKSVPSPSIDIEKELAPREESVAEEIARLRLSLIGAVDQAGAVKRATMNVAESVARTARASRPMMKAIVAGDSGNHAEAARLAVAGAGRPAAEEGITKRFNALRG